MTTQQPPREPTRAQRARRRARAGQSLVEYALTVALIFLVAQGTGRAVYDSFVAVVTNLRSAINVSDDPTPTIGPSPTVRMPPHPPTLTPLPPTPTVIAMCEIPDLVGLQYNVAVAEWLNHGFKTGTLTKPNGASSTFPVGNQSLLKGAYMPCSSTTMHVTPKQCTVPDLEGQVFSAARSGAWTTNGFTAANLLSPDGVGESFTIGSQSLAAGASVDCEATMLAEPQLCSVPNLVGKNFNINGNGTANTTWDDDFLPANLTRGAGMPNSFTVASQTLAAGAIVSCEAAMEVNPALCTVPDFTGAQYLGAPTLWSNRGFTGSVLKPPYTPSDFTITGQSLVAGTQQVCAGTTITLQPNMCTVPSMVGQYVTDARAAWTSNGFALANLGPAGLNVAHKVQTQSLSAGLSVACSSGATLTAIDVTPFVRVKVPSDGASGDNDVSNDRPRVEAEAYDPEVASGTRGIARVVFTFKAPNGTEYTTSVNAGGGNTKYCAFGGTSTCSRGFNPSWSNSLATGWWEITATAYPVDPTKSPVTSSVVRFEVKQ